MEGTTSFNVNDMIYLSTAIFEDQGTGNTPNPSGT